MNTFDNMNAQASQGYQNLFNSNPNSVYISTNKWVVNSLQEALQKYAPPNSRGIYHSQDGEYEYEIVVDGNGIKTYNTYKLTLCTKEQSQQPLTHEDLRGLIDKIKSLEDKINGSTTNTSNGSSEMPRSKNGKSNTEQL